MKKFCFFLVLFLSVAGFSFSQSTKNLPAGMDLQNMNPDDIPDAGTLKKMGLSDSDIQAAMALKNGQKVANSNQTQVEKPKRNPAAEKDSLLKRTPVLLNDSLLRVALNDSAYRLPPVTIYGQSFFRNKNLNFFNNVNNSKAPENYLLSSDDKIAIAVWGYSDYNEVFTIDRDGYIQPREAGRIYLKGIALSDARKLIEKKFSSFIDFKNSKLDVTVATPRTITVNIVGEVLHPGSYSMPGVNTAFNALIMANGTSSLGSVRNIYIRRGGKTIKTLDLYSFLMNPDSNDDFFLEDNDYILVPPADRVVNIKGEVKRPFSYELKDMEGIVELTKYSGGIKANGFTGAILVKRVKGGRTSFWDVNLDSLMLVKKNFVLMDGDTITVKSIPDFPEGFVEISGSVRVPGKYQFLDGEKISQFIKRSGGTMDETYPYKAYMIHQNQDLSRSYSAVNLENILKSESSPDNLAMRNYDKLVIFSRRGFSDPDSITVFGSVRNPSRLVYGEGLKVKDAIYLSGGFKKEAANNRIEISRLSNIGKGSQDTSRVIVLTAKIGYDLSLEKGVEDFPLQPFDQIFIRKLANFGFQENVIIAGEVLYPGSYSLLSKNEKLFSIIERSGGLTDWAFPEGTKLHRSADSLGYLFTNFDREGLKDLASESNYVLKEGDSIFIPKMNDLVAIKGALNYPNIDSINQINAPFSKHHRAKYYINNYGVGFSKLAIKRKTYVVRPGGFIHRTTRFGLFNVYPRVTKGSTVVAVYKPEKQEKFKKKSDPVDWNKAIENVTVKVTAVLTVYLILTQVLK